jgi:hypothetical protein
MKGSDMIRAALTFPLSMTDLVTKTIMHLPEILRPTVISLAEDEPATAIGDINVFLDTFKMPTIGVYLENSVVRDFLIHMAAPRPFFGFACTQEELEYRNRITVKFGINIMESWVGRDTRRYIPGLYWWTLLPASLAEQHGIPLSILVRAAQEHIELEGQQHLLRFYESPEDWRSAAVMAELYHSCPGIFDVEKLRPKLQGMTNFLEINAILHDWT